MCLLELKKQEIKKLGKRENTQHKNVPSNQKQESAHGVWLLADRAAFRAMSGYENVQLLKATCYHGLWHHGLWGL
jgi:hypothetical protein